MRAPGLAYTTMVPKSSPATQTKPSVSKSQERSTSTAQPAQGKSSNLAQVESPHMSLIREGLNKYALSPAAKDVLMVHGEKAHQSSITRTLANGISTVGTKTLMFFTLE